MKISRVGKFGEVQLNVFLKKLIKDDYFLLENLLIPIKDSEYKTEIDKLLISQKGIFCIEVKYWGGYLSGSEYGDWTQTQYMYGFKRTRKLPNPVTQNCMHAKALANLLCNESRIFNIVLLTGYSKRNIKSLNVYDLATFRGLYRGLGKCISEDEVKILYLTLSKYVASNEELVKHAAEVNKYYKNKRNKPSFEFVDD